MDGKRRRKKDRHAFVGYVGLGGMRGRDSNPNRNVSGSPDHARDFRNEPGKGSIPRFATTETDILSKSRSDLFQVSELVWIVASWRRRYEARVRESIEGGAILEAAAGPDLRAWAGLRREPASLESPLRKPASEDPVCWPPITVLGVGPVVAGTPMSAHDDLRAIAKIERHSPLDGADAGTGPVGGT